MRAGDVTISRGRRGIRIFTSDKEQLRENVTRSGHRPLALELAAGFAPRRAVRLWDRLHHYMLRFGRRAADNFCQLTLSHRNHQTIEIHEHKNTPIVGRAIRTLARSKSKYRLNRAFCRHSINSLFPNSKARGRNSDSDWFS